MQVTVRPTAVYPHDDKFSRDSHEFKTQRPPYHLILIHALQIKTGSIQKYSVSATQISKPNFAP